ncbi:MAG: pyridoxal-phosphate dependent enzyme [bacterium]
MEVISFEPPEYIPTLDDIRAAAKRIQPFAHRTPVLTCTALDELAQAQLFFKCENFQKVGAFKFRGATNAVLSLDEERAARGVATHSSGNHAAALALAARNRAIPAHVVMPSGAPAVKKAAVRGYGARIIECEPTLQAREATLDRVVEETGATFVHPYNDPRVVAGAGTAALELLTDHPDLDVIMAPVGGGGLMSGTAIAAANLCSDIRVIGAEPAGADDAYLSLRAGQIIPSVNPQTICDGLLTSLGPLSFTVLSGHLERIVTVREGAIIRAMRLVWERMKILIEPSSAVPLGAVLMRELDLRGLKIGIIFSGGNVNLDALPWQ